MEAAMPAVIRLTGLAGHAFSTVPAPAVFDYSLP
jgi:hypothetical protein